MSPLRIRHDMKVTIGNWSTAKGHFTVLFIYSFFYMCGTLSLQQYCMHLLDTDTMIYDVKLYKDHCRQLIITKSNKSIW